MCGRAKPLFWHLTLGCLLVPSLLICDGQGQTVVLVCKVLLLLCIPSAIVFNVKRVKYAWHLLFLSYVSLIVLISLISMPSYSNPKDPRVMFLLLAAVGLYDLFLSRKGYIQSCAHNFDENRQK